MQREGGDEKGHPKVCAVPPDPGKISKTGYADVQPVALRMCADELPSIRCTEHLHGVITRDEKQRADGVDQQVNPDAHAPRLVAAAAEECTHGALNYMLGIFPDPYCDDGVEDAHCRGAE